MMEKVLAQESCESTFFCGKNLVTPFLTEG
jgi:hypothetical protein